MASTYSTNLRLELIGTGEQQGTWGSTTNVNLGTLLEEAIGGYVFVTVSDVGDTTLTTANGAADQARNMTLNLTGTISAARNVICPAIEKVYLVKNATTGGFAVTFKVSGQTGISIPNGYTMLVYVDGTDVRQAGISVSPSGVAQIASIELGNNSDTTISRSAAGVIAVEGGVIPKENRANTFTANQIIEVTDNTNAALRITQLGTADAIRVEDSSNPDSTPFIVDASGNVGIGPTTTNGRLHVERAAASAGWIVNAKTAGVSNESGFYMDASNNVEVSARNGSGTLNVALRSSGDSFLLGGNVGIGTASPSTKLHVLTPSATNTEIRVGNSVSYNAFLIDSSGNSQIYTPASNQIFSVNSSERMRIDSSGNVMVGATALPSFGSSTTSGTWVQPSADVAIARSGNCLALQRGATDGDVATFWRGTSQKGYIYVTSTGTTYNTLSDYRLKENVVPLTGASDRVMQLPVHRFNFVSEPGSTVDGFLAHEAQSVVPEAVIGQKDAVDENGKPVYQGIDQSKLVPLLTAALQEAITKIDALEARLAALESA